MSGATDLTKEKPTRGIILNDQISINSFPASKLLIEIKPNGGLLSLAVLRKKGKFPGLAIFGPDCYHIARISRAGSLSEYPFGAAIRPVFTTSRCTANLRSTKDF